MDIVNHRAMSACRGCYLEEDHGGNSRRHKENQKSAIFQQAFEISVRQSPGWQHFNHSANNNGFTNNLPIDLHIDLGNFCNLACKMCNAQASSTIASQEVRWGIESSRPYLGTNWTADEQVWLSFKTQLLEIHGLNNIHFMGGETLLTPRLENLVDWLIQHDRLDVCLSFVTNGTVYNSRLLEKLKNFRRVGIEISIETLTAHNAYQRQGTDTSKVLDNIAQYQQWSNGNSITVSLRPAPSLLTIGYYPTLLQFAYQNNLIVKSNLCYNPKFLYAIYLPDPVKKLYLSKYQDFVTKYKTVTALDINVSDPNNSSAVVAQEAQMCMNILQQPSPGDSETQLAIMVDHCRKWDKVYGLDARKLYPELVDVWDRYGY